MSERINLLPDEYTTGDIWNDSPARAEREGRGINNRCYGSECYSDEFAAQGLYDLFPSRKHVNVGARRTRQQGATPLMGYHQWHQEMPTNVDRCMVETWIDARGESSKVLRLLHGVRARYGGVTISEHFFQPVHWAPQQNLKFIVEFQIATTGEEQVEIQTARGKLGKRAQKSDGLPTSLYANIELRGRLAWHPKDDPPEVLSFNAQSPQGFYLKWWDRMIDGDPVNGRTKVLCPHELQHGAWYRFAAILTGSEIENQWDWTVRVNMKSGEKWQSVWEYHDAARPLIGIEQVGFFHIGNEHNLPKNQSGGIWRFTQPKALTWQGADDGELSENLPVNDDTFYP